MCIHIHNHVGHNKFTRFYDSRWFSVDLRIHNLLPYSLLIFIAVLRFALQLFLSFSKDVLLKAVEQQDTDTRSSSVRDPCEAELHRYSSVHLCILSASYSDSCIKYYKCVQVFCNDLWEEGFSEKIMTTSKYGRSFFGHFCFRWSFPLISAKLIWWSPFLSDKRKLPFEFSSDRSSLASSKVNCILVTEVSQLIGLT